MFKYLHTADIHLDSPLRGLEAYEGAPVAAVRQATREAMKNLVHLAIAEGVDFVLIAGDLYDGDWPDYNTGLFFAGQMRRLRDADIPVYAIAGNHDAQSQITRGLTPPENVRLLTTAKPETCRIERIAVAIHGQGFADRAVTENLAASYPAPVAGAFNIGMLHTAADGREGHDPYAPCSVDGLRNHGYDYWALGHVHTREVLSEDPPIVFPGNLQGRHANETGAKGCYVVTVDDSGNPTLDFRPLDVVRWHRVHLDARDATGHDELCAAFRNVLDNLREPAGDRLLAVRVTVTGASPAHAWLAAHAERFTNELRLIASDHAGGPVWLERVCIDTTPHAASTVEAQAGPLADLLDIVAELAGTDPGESHLANTLDDLRAKLPPELREDADGPVSPEAIAGYARQARGLLEERLRGTAEEEEA